MKLRKVTDNSNTDNYPIEDYKAGAWRHSRTFYVSTSDIHTENSWSEPIYVNQRGIDPSLCFDGDKVYLTTQGINNDNDRFWGIYQSEINIENGRHLTERRQLWEGHTFRATSKERPEGPHLYHIGDWYYLQLAEGERYIVRNNIESCGELNGSM
jgi:xylan 1,4-beta-xylosidase